MPTIKKECGSCGGTGLYIGFCEAEGTAVICLTCGGKGWHEYSYKEFKGRKRKRGIKEISRSRGSLIATGVGRVGNAMTYKEFEKLIPDKS